MTSNKKFGYQFRWLPIKVTSKWKKQEWWKHLTGKIPNAHVNIQDTFNTNLKHLYIIWDCVRAWALTLNSQNFIYTTKMKSINQNLYIFFLVNLSFYWLKSRAKERKKIVRINIKIKKRIRKRMYTHDMHAHQPNYSISYLDERVMRWARMLLHANYSEIDAFLRWNVALLRIHGSLFRLFFYFFK